MQKILYGAMGLAATGAIVTASAFALFTAQATVSGINFSTGSLGLEVSTDNTTFSSNLDADLDITNAYPGFGEDDSEFAPIFIRNTSDDFALNLTAQLTAANGWTDSELKSYVEVAVLQEVGDPTDEDYKSLTEWNATPQDLGELGAGSTEDYIVYVRLLSTAPNELQNKSLQDITFTLIGTQAEETT